MDFHCGNQLIGAATVEADAIKKLGNLGLGLDFHITSWGSPFQ
jgi:hypothetical protein